MSSDLRLRTIVGSLRTASVNRVVADAARAAAPDGVSIEEIPLGDVPFFNGDLEDAGDPAAVSALKDAVRAADGLIIVTPEYNISVPAVTKNAIDWLSRPYGAGPINTTPVGVVAASPGGRGGLGAREHLTDTLSRISDGFFATTLGVPRVNDSIDDGVLGGEALDELTTWLASFVAFVKDRSAG